MNPALVSPWWDNKTMCKKMIIQFKKDLNRFEFPYDKLS